MSILFVYKQYELYRKSLCYMLLFELPLDGLITVVIRVNLVLFDLALDGLIAVVRRENPAAVDGMMI